MVRPRRRVGPLGDRDSAGEPVLSLDHAGKVINVRVGSAHGGDQQRPTVRVLVDEDVVKATRILRCPYPRHLLEAVRQVGHVKDHCTQIGICPTLAKLRGLHVVVAAVVPEDFPVHHPRALVKLRGLDPPAVNDPGVLGVREVDYVDAMYVHAAHVGKRPTEVLLELDIRDAQRCPQWKMAEHLHIRTSLRARGGLLRQRHARSQRRQQKHRCHGAQSTERSLLHSHSPVRTAIAGKRLSSSLLVPRPGQNGRV